MRKRSIAIGISSEGSSAESRTPPWTRWCDWHGPYAARLANCFSKRVYRLLSARKRWRGEVTSRQNRLRAPGVWPWSAAGGPAFGWASPAAKRRRFGRFPPADPRASRRLCRTLGLPESRKSPAKWIVFVCRRSRSPVCPDPAAGFARRSPRRKNLPLAGVEIRSRVAYPVPAAVGGCRAKCGNRKMAEREGFEPPLPFWSKRALQARPIGHSGTSPSSSVWQGLVPEKGLEPIRP